jgi:hypothetical protein
VVSETLNSTVSAGQQDTWQKKINFDQRGSSHLQYGASIGKLEDSALPTPKDGRAFYLALKLSASAQTAPPPPSYLAAAFLHPHPGICNPAG